MKEVKIKDICEKGSSNLKQKDIESENGSYPVFGASGLIGHLDTYHQENSYIAIVKDGSGIGRVTFMPPQSSVIGTMQYILPKTDYDIKYIGYCLQSLDLSKYKQGAAIPHIYFRDYGERLVKVVDSLSEQKEIVEYLDSSFAKIDKLKENAAKNLEEAKALFQSALKDALEPKEGWENKKLGEVANVIHGKNQKEVLSANGKYPIYGSGGTIMGYATEYLCEAGTTILGRKGTINNPQFINHKFWNVDTAFGISARKDIDSKFLYFVVKIQNWSKMNTGTTLPSLTQAIVKNVTIHTPSLSEQQSIVSHLDSLNEKVNTLQQNYSRICNECDALKQAILRQVFE